MSNAALVRRLRSPRRLEQRQAVLALLELALDGSSADCDGLVEAGCIPALCSVLRSSEAVQEHAASSLLLLVSKSRLERAMIEATPAIPALVHMAKHGSDGAMAGATAALLTLASGSAERSAAVVAAGGHVAFVRPCASGSANERTVACSLLRQLAQSCLDSRAAMVDAGAFTSLVSVLQAPDTASSRNDVQGAATAAKENATLAMADLCFGGTAGDPPDRAAVAAAAAAGAPEALVQLLRSSPDGSLQFAAAQALSCLAGSHDPAVCHAIASGAGLAALTNVVCTSSTTDVLRAALTALGNVAIACQESYSSLAAMPEWIPRLAQLASSTAAGTPVPRMAVQLLADMARHSKQLAAEVAGAGAGVVRALAAALHSPAVDVQQRAAYLAHVLAEQGQAAALRAAGVDRALQQLAPSPNAQVRGAASASLSSLSTAPSPAPSSSTVEQADVSPADAHQAQQQRPRRVCAAPGCGATHGLRRCGGCGEMRYCSEACSRAHWKAHRAECRRLQAERQPAGGSGSSGT